METQETTTENVDPNVVDAAATQLEAETTTETQETTTEAAGTEETTTEETVTENSAPEYAPKLKFKVRDDEHDMPEWAHQFVKDEETEKNFVDLFTAQQGIELAKKEREEYKGKYDNLESAVIHVSKLANEGKIDRFIQELGLPKKAFIDYAIKELQYAELPENERREIDAQRQAEFHQEQQSIQQQTLQTQYEAQQVQMRTLELNNTILSNPQYAEAERSYDTSVGAPGSFKQLVAQCGNYHWTQNGRDIGTEQAIQEAIRLGRVSAEATPTQTGNVGTQEKPVQQQAKPVIPNLKAGGASPVKKGFTSIDQIREYNANRR